MGTQIITNPDDFEEVEGEIDKDYQEHQDKMKVNVKAASKSVGNKKKAAEPIPTEAAAATTAVESKELSELAESSK